MPLIGAFCELAMCLYTPSLNNLGAKSPIVSNPYRKYSRFLETRAGDRVRSALRGVGGSLLWRRSQGPRSAARPNGCFSLFLAIAGEAAANAESVHSYQAAGARKFK